MIEALSPAEIQALKKEILSCLHCALPGIVESFDAKMQTASVRPAVRNLPLLRDVPVFFPGTRGSAVTWPVEAGDECLLIFADSDIDVWFDSGEAEDAASDRRHALPDAFAFVGFRSRPNVLEEFPEGPRFFDGAMAPHNHDDRYYTESEMDTKLSGKAASDHTHDDRYYTESEMNTKLSGKKNTQTAVSDPAADGTGISFIDTLSQNAQGVISPHKRTVRGASASQSGLMSAADKTKMDSMAMITFGKCATAAATAEKAVTLDNANWQLQIGSIIAVKFTYTNTAGSADAPVTLNVNSTGAFQIWYNASAYTGTSSTVCGYANRTNYYVYSGTHWIWLGCGTDTNSNTIPAAYCSTAAGTAAKTASCSGYVLTAKSYIHVIVTTANTSASALTLKINGKGAKAIAINGSASGASNYTLPAGSYLVYYDGTYYQFRTDGYLPGLGPAATVAVGKGGTGQTGTGATSTIADIATAGTDCEITTAQYAYWGKVAMVRLVVKKTTAVSSGTTSLCTLVSGKRPKYQAPAIWFSNKSGWITTGGIVRVSGAITAGASVEICSTFILA